MTTTHTCPVCGFPGLEQAPRLPSGAGSYEICPSCGFEFGYDDDAQGRTYESHRAEWIAGGSQWWDTGFEPEGWNARTQLDRLLRLDQDGPSVSS